MKSSAVNPSKMLLHACCGPCSLEPVRLLREAGFEPVIFYANSNIHPADEYQRRLATLRDWAASEDVPVIEGVYDPDTWERDVARPTGAVSRSSISEPASALATEPQPELLRSAFSEISAPESNDAFSESPSAKSANVAQSRAERCRRCYRLRFAEAAAYAKAHGFTVLGTTLSVSPYQFTDIVREELERAAGEAGLEARFEDYRPYYDEATRRSRAAGMYRQNYCGCRLSKAEAADERAERKALRQAERAERRAAYEREHREEIEAARQQAADRKAERAAYDAKQQRKRAILKALREEAKHANKLDSMQTREPGLDIPGPFHETDEDSLVKAASSHTFNRKHENISPNNEILNPAADPIDFSLEESRENL